jgi:membrane protease YdiL (CAAX protease family)
MHLSVPFRSAMDAPSVRIATALALIMVAATLYVCASLLHVMWLLPAGLAVLVAAAFRLYPEPPPSARALLQGAGLGILLAIAWIGLIAWPQRAQTEMLNPAAPDTAQLIAGILNGVLLGPLLLEKLLRGLLLPGLRTTVGPWGASLLVSALVAALALAAGSPAGWAFASSLMLCIATLRLQLGTLPRALAASLVAVAALGWNLSAGFAALA